jgi:hypothetical protein
MRRTRWARAPAPLLGLLVTVATAIAGATTSGCGDIDAGSTAFAGTVLYADPQGAYQLRLLEPPWIPISTAGETIFIVPPSDLNAATEVSDALFSLHVDAVSGSAERDRDNDLAAATVTSALGLGPVGMGSEETVAGATAYEVSWQPAAGSYERDVFVATSASSTFRLQFAATQPIAGDDMITQMILGFEAL